MSHHSIYAGHEGNGKLAKRKARYSLESGVHTTVKVEDFEVRRQSHPVVASHNIAGSNARMKAKPPKPPYPSSSTDIARLIKHYRASNNNIHVIDARSKSPTQACRSPTPTKLKKEPPGRPALPPTRPKTPPQMRPSKSSSRLFTPPQQMRSSSSTQWLSNSPKMRPSASSPRLSNSPQIRPPSPLHSHPLSPPHASWPSTHPLPPTETSRLPPPQSPSPPPKWPTSPPPLEQPATTPPSQKPSSSPPSKTTWYLSSPPPQSSTPPPKPTESPPPPVSSSSSSRARRIPVRPAPPPPGDKALSRVKRKANSAPKGKKKNSAPKVPEPWNPQNSKSSILSMLFPKSDSSKNAEEVDSSVAGSKEDEPPAVTVQEKEKPRRTGLDAIYAIIQRKKSKIKQEEKEKEEEKEEEREEEKEPEPEPELEEKEPEPELEENGELEEEEEEEIPPLPPRTYLYDNSEWNTDTTQRWVFDDTGTPANEMKLYEEVVLGGNPAAYDAFTSIDADNGYRLLTRSSSFDCERESILASKLGGLGRLPSSDALYASLHKYRGVEKAKEEKVPFLSSRSQSDDNILRIFGGGGSDSGVKHKQNNAGGVTVESSEYESLRYFCQAQVSHSQENDTYAEMHNPRQVYANQPSKNIDQEDIYIVMSPCAPIKLPIKHDLK